MFSWTNYIPVANGCYRSRAELNVCLLKVIQSLGVWGLLFGLLAWSHFPHGMKTLWITGTATIHLRSALAGARTGFARWWPWSALGVPDALCHLSLNMLKHHGVLSRCWFAVYFQMECQTIHYKPVIFWLGTCCKQGECVGISLDQLGWTWRAAELSRFKPDVLLVASYDLALHLHRAHTVAWANILYSRMPLGNMCESHRIGAFVFVVCGFLKIF